MNKRKNNEEPLRKQRPFIYTRNWQLVLDKYLEQGYNFEVSYGLVAQLGAHHIRIVGVGSSNLLESTKSHPLGWLFKIKNALTHR